MSFNFDLGVGGSNRSKSLNDQRNKTPSYSYSSSSSTQSKPSWQQPSKPAWTHQPAVGTGLNGPTSMVGDISGKSWNSSGPSADLGIGIVGKDPHLFGDLLNSALGQGSKGNGNVPLKNVAPARNQSAYSMGNLGSSLPKTSNSANSGINWGSSSSSGGVNVNANKSSSLGGPSMKGMSGGVSGVGNGIGGNRDPFGSLVDFGMKQKPAISKSTGNNSKVNSGDNAFGDFQNASSKPSAAAFPSGGFGVKSNDFMGSGANSNIDDFGIFTDQKQKQPSAQTAASDPLEMFFPSSGGTATSKGSGGGAGQHSSEVDDWGLDTEFGGSGDGGIDSGGATTELEGLPPPPAGVTASSAKNKGIDNKTQGQYADAIKWLSWAVVLLEKSGDTPSTAEVLSCRASCYKEVGEYKKAVADCSKVLENDAVNVSVLVQRALLYESMEKYRLGADDLRSVLKIDPVNKVARSTIHRLNKLAD